MKKAPGDQPGGLKARGALGVNGYSRIRLYPLNLCLQVTLKRHCYRQGHLHRGTWQLVKAVSLHDLVEGHFTCLSVDTLCGRFTSPVAAARLIL